MNSIAKRKAGSGRCELQITLHTAIRGTLWKHVPTECLQFLITCAIIWLHLTFAAVQKFDSHALPPIIIRYNPKQY